MTIGIEALNVYCGVASIGVAELFDGRGLDRSRLDNLAMRRRSIGLACEDPVTHAVNAARPIVDALAPAERDRIEMLLVSTESGVDYSKSIASYVHEQLGLSRNCRLVELKQACYAATAAVQLCAGYLASGVSPGGKALVIATDVALVDEHASYAEPAMGVGAAAVLVSDEAAVLAIDLGAFGNYSYETLDSARPTPTFDIADADRSLFAYLDCLSNSYLDYTSRVDEVDFATTFSYLVMHTPFAGMVRAAHRKLVREHKGGDADADFRERVAPSLVYPAEVGNLCSGSVYLALASLIDNAEVEREERVGLYSYGSGCSAEFFSGVISPRSRVALAPLAIGRRLEQRVPITFERYTAMLAENLRCLVPQRDRTIELAPCEPFLAEQEQELLIFTGVKEFHRQYEWRAP